MSGAEAIATGANVDWLGFGLAILVIELTPGPNMAWLAGLSLTEGRRAGLAATLGIALGLAINASVAALGLTALIALDHPLQHLLRLAGAAMMATLAWLAWRGGDAKVPTRLANRKNFGAGLMLNLLNPKAFLLFVMVAPPFLSGAPLATRQALAMAGISVGIATLVHLLLVALAASAHQFAADPARTRLVRRIMAGLMLGMAAWFLIE